MFTIFGAVIALAILITVHEMGHLIAARLNGVVVEKFSLGFGPKLVSFNKWNINFRISLIPLGGYVKMKGENPDEESDDPDSFRAKKWWQRAIIAFSGPFANFLLALLIFIISFLIGRNYEDFNPVIGKMSNDTYKELQINDRILELNGNSNPYASVLNFQTPFDGITAPSLVIQYLLTPDFLTFSSDNTLLFV